MSGQLAENKDAWDAFTVLFPSITASGIPKNAALNAIMQIEKTPRELYSGAILLLDDMRFDAALVLRSRISGQPALLDTSGGGNHRAIYTGTRN
ncbi:Salicylate synthetase [Klebsiella pneumoniae subsp. ozaenae]|uniref:Salicylate synthetase n=1 Tax=Klebsiella pneumoniae subsp. ozaenae TaxID=574 RepID=A0A378BJP8_KLEPO|nr:Salicylate synthetase [Klebsiella pneumoniae subsp. ozaenae]